MTAPFPDYSLGIESAGPSSRGGFEFRMRPGIDLAKHLTQSVRSVLDGHGADNYVEMRFADDTGEEYIATFRRQGGKTPDELRRQAEAERDTAQEVARSNMRHVAVLTELAERVEKYADRLQDYCSPHGVAARYAKELRAELSRPTTVEQDRYAGVPDGMEWIVRVTLADGTTVLRHEDAPFQHRRSADDYAANARQYPQVTAAEVLCRIVWHGQWRTPTSEETRP